MLFSLLPGPQGSWLSPAFREAFSARRHRRFARPRSPSRAPGVRSLLGRRARAPGAGSASPPKIPSRPLPAGVPSLRVVRRRAAVRCLPMVKAVSGGLRSLGRRWTPLPAPHHPGRAAGSSFFSGGLRLCWAAALADLCQPGRFPSPRASQTRRGPACLGSSRGEPALGTGPATAAGRSQAAAARSLTTCPVQGNKPRWCPFWWGSVPLGDDSRREGH